MRRNILIVEKKAEGVMKTLLYTVKEGETLAEISGKFRTTSSALAAKNGIVGEPFEGMYLLVDEEEAFGYTVRPFDTVESIAAKFGVPSQKLKAFNGIDAVFVGQRILVPTEKTGT